MKNKYLDIPDEVVEEKFDWAQKLFARLDIPLPDNLEEEVAEMVWNDYHDYFWNYGHKHFTNAAIDMEVSRYENGGSIVLTEKNVVTEAELEEERAKAAELPF